MIERFVDFVIQHAHLAHWFIFGSILLAGLNIPISADLMIIIGAVLAATVIPEHTLLLFSSVFLGCYFSAWLAYWMGRVLGPVFMKWRFFRKFINPEKLEKLRTFYQKYGFLTLLVGRFIPFGVRNGIFMSTGMSRLHFGTFIVRDFFACLLWSSTMFYLFYLLGQNYKLLYQYVKTFNVLIFSIFALSVIGWFWYKKRKKRSVLDSF